LCCGRSRPSPPALPTGPSCPAPSPSAARCDDITVTSLGAARVQQRPARWSGRRHPCPRAEAPRARGAAGGAPF
jgi:hypothetical protein